MSRPAFLAGPYTPEPAAGIWFVAFPHALAIDGPPRWWQRPLRPGFRHVLAAQAAPEGRSVLIEHVGERLVVQVRPQHVGELLRELRDRLGALILAARDPADRPARPRLRGPMTCVEAVKALLGIRAVWIVTPRQLFRHLRAGGARLVA